MTHIVTDCTLNDKNESFVVKRTIKIIHGLCLDVKIVSGEWIRQCLLQQKVIPDTNYLSVGIVANDKFIYYHKTNKHCNLFKGIKFFLRPGTNPMISASKLESFIVLCGGEVVGEAYRGVMLITMKPETEDPPKGEIYYSYMFIIDAISMNQLPSTQDYI